MDKSTDVDCVDIQDWLCVVTMVWNGIVQISNRHSVLEINQPQITLDRVTLYLAGNLYNTDGRALKASLGYS